MERIEARHKGLGWRLAGATITPFVVASFYLVLTRWPSYRFTTTSDCAGLAVSVLAGSAFVALLPMSRLHRVISLLVYVPAFVVVLFFYTFWFIAVVFHDAL